MLLRNENNTSTGSRSQVGFVVASLGRLIEEVLNILDFNNAVLGYCVQIIFTSLGRVWYFKRLAVEVIFSHIFLL